MGEKSGGNEGEKGKKRGKGRSFPIFFFRWEKDWDELFQLRTKGRRKIPPGMGILGSGKGLQEHSSFSCFLGKEGSTPIPGFLKDGEFAGEQGRAWDKGRFPMDEEGSQKYWDQKYSQKSQVLPKFGIIPGIRRFVLLPGFPFPGNSRCAGVENWEFLREYPGISAGNAEMAAVPQFQPGFWDSQASLSREISLQSREIPIPKFLVFPQDLAAGAPRRPRHRRCHPRAARGQRRLPAIGESWHLGIWGCLGLFGVIRGDLGAVPAAISRCPHCHPRVPVPSATPPGCSQCHFPLSPPRVSSAIPLSPLSPPLSPRSPPHLLTVTPWRSCQSSCPCPHRHPPWPCPHCHPPCPCPPVTSPCPCPLCHPPSLCPLSLSALPPPVSLSPLSHHRVPPATSVSPLPPPCPLCHPPCVPSATPVSPPRVPSATPLCPCHVPAMEIWEFGIWDGIRVSPPRG